MRPFGEWSGKTGEYITFNHKDPEKIIRSLFKSRWHRRGMLQRMWTHVGIAHCTDPQNKYPTVLNYVAGSFTMNQRGREAIAKLRGSRPVSPPEPVPKEPKEPTKVPPKVNPDNANKIMRKLFSETTRLKKEIRSLKEQLKQKSSNDGCAPKPPNVSSEKREERSEKPSQAPLRRGTLLPPDSTRNWASAPYSHRNVSFRVINHSSRAVLIHWMDSNGNPILKGEVGAVRKWRHRTPVNQVVRFSDAETGTVLNYFIPSRKRSSHNYVVLRDPPSGI